MVNFELFCREFIVLYTIHDYLQGIKPIVLCNDTTLETRVVSACWTASLGGHSPTDASGQRKRRFQNQSRSASISSAKLKDERTVAEEIRHEKRKRSQIHNG